MSEIHSVKSKIHLNILHIHCETILYWKNLRTFKIKFPFLTKDQPKCPSQTHKKARAHTHTYTHTHLHSLNCKRGCEIQGKKEGKGISSHRSPERSLLDNKE